MSLETVNNNSNLDVDKLAKPTKDVVIFIDTREQPKTDKIKIYFQHEPLSINTSILHAAEHWKQYDLIITYNKEVLQTVPNAVFHFFYSPTWLDEKDYLHVDTSIKEFKVSSLTGFKLMCPAHIFRRKLYMNQLLCDPNSFTFFRSAKKPIIDEIGNNPLIGDSLSEKFELFKRFQFSIVIENTREANCFTEKIIDCVLSKTIPIYYGCENIREFFNTEGWIIIETLDIQNLLSKLTLIDQNYYSRYTHVIEENYLKAFEYKDIYARLNTCLKNLPPPHHGLFV
jgi:hypothetical protein